MRKILFSLLTLWLCLGLSGCMHKPSASGDSTYAAFVTARDAYNFADTSIIAFGKVAVNLRKTCTTAPDSDPCKLGLRMAAFYTAKLQPGTVRAHAVFIDAANLFEIYLQVKSEDNILRVINKIAELNAILTDLRTQLSSPDATSMNREDAQSLSAFMNISTSRTRYEVAQN